MVAEWRNRMSTTYYCIKNGLVELDGKLSRKDKDLIAPCVKREELVKMRRTSVSDSKS